MGPAVKCACKEPKPVRITEEVFIVFPHPKYGPPPMEAIICDRCGSLLRDWREKEIIADLNDAATS